MPNELSPVPIPSGSEGDGPNAHQVEQQVHLRLIHWAAHQLAHDLPGRWPHVVIPCYTVIP